MESVFLLEKSKKSNIKDTLKVEWNKEKGFIHIKINLCTKDNETKIKDREKESYKTIKRKSFMMVLYIYIYIQTNRWMIRG